eukprot:CAMPEP_0203652344 /NCGR_PEP_ID=MMETSP0088-20131115/29935_1 /ASSEMBLY_ACC=CAM_ASM_001087 /TAXON_ID=426623 /ORGANISM="Chaetoceros affinis, Strain CCMP159" /LENGTH=107 /DNA_ID=CAMNT_0050511851 /DNA_START=36 /DNA_END=356 /DNA_ORIENTATION=-
MVLPKLQVLLLVLVGLSYKGSLLCHSFSISSPSNTQLSTPILTASPDDDGKTAPAFDIGCVANPVVLPPYDEDSPDGEGAGEWQCYYYGNAGTWNGDRKCFLPTGST